MHVFFCLCNPGIFCWLPVERNSVEKRKKERLLKPSLPWQTCLKPQLLIHGILGPSRVVSRVERWNHSQQIRIVIRIHYGTALWRPESHVDPKGFDHRPILSFRFEARICRKPNEKPCLFWRPQPMLYLSSGIAPDAVMSELLDNRTGCLNALQ